MARKVSNPTLSSRNSRRPLKRRREPYWQVIVQGCALGYRKHAKGGSWIARYRTPDGKQVYHAIGPADDNTDDGATALSYDTAQAKARGWFAEQAKTLGKRGDYTVGEAIDDYIAYLKRERSPAAAYDSEKRAGKWIKPKLGKIIVHTLKRDTLYEWWGGLLEPDDKGRVMTKDSCNHVLTVLKAALNRAADLRPDDVPSVDAWARLKPYRGAGDSRKVVLTAAQRTRLINTTSGGLRDLILGALLTGARPPGELASIRCQDFDPDTGTVTIKGKTGVRVATLDRLALQFFKDLSAGRHPRRPAVHEGRRRALGEESPYPTVE
jgi:integrase